MRLVALVLLSSSVALAAPAFTASAGPGVISRSFSWQGDPSTTLLPTSQPIAAMVSVDLTWFPGAHVTEGVGSWFGVFGQGDVGLGLWSRLANSDAVFANSVTRLRAGALARFPLGQRAWLLVHAGYARQGFSTSPRAVNATVARPNVPDVLFEGPRAGLGVRLKLGETTELEVLAGGQYALGLGELGNHDWFPLSTAFSTDALIGVSFPLVEHVRLRLGAQWLGTFVTLGGNGLYRDQGAMEHSFTGTATLQWAM
ncbi:MAG: hypothetical protein ACOZQL_30775 [Myxococcota bacterium]